MNSTNSLNSIETMEPLSFKVSLSLEAHAKAQLQRDRAHSQKAKQVYLNTLAIYAVNYYLQCQGFETDWETSDSANPTLQSFLNIADLNVKDRGTIECIPVLPGSEVLYIPPEVWAEIGDERRGYVAVQLTESLREATLLGFVETVASSEVPLHQLQSIELLSSHLNQPPKSVPVILSQWFQERWDAGWQSLSSLLEEGQQQLAFQGLGIEAVLRRDSRLRDATSVKGIKFLDLGREFGDRAVALLVGVMQKEEQKIQVRVRLIPTGKQPCLPQNIQLSLISSSGEILQESQARDRDKMIQLNRFTCTAEEVFCIRVSLGELTFTENFAIAPICLEG